MNPYTETLRVGTWNAGNGSMADCREILRHVDALCLQECSDQDRMMDAMRANGFSVIRPLATGAAATPVIYEPDVLQFTRPLLRPLLWGGDLDWGPGTGPDHGKQKWLVGGYFIHKPSRRRVAIGSAHKPAGHKPGNRREVAATLQSRRTVEVFKGYTGIPIVGADNNAEPDMPCMAPFRRADWKIDQLVGERKPTHGGWCPDHIAWRDDERVQMAYHETMANGSDHDADLLTLRLSKRGR